MKNAVILHGSFLHDPNHARDVDVIAMGGVSREMVLELVDAYQLKNHGKVFNLPLDLHYVSTCVINVVAPCWGKSEFYVLQCEGEPIVTLAPRCDLSAFFRALARGTFKTNEAIKIFENILSERREFQLKTIAQGYIFREENISTITNALAKMARPVTDYLPGDWGYFFELVRILGWPDRLMRLEEMKLDYRGIELPGVFFEVEDLKHLWTVAETVRMCI